MYFILLFTIISHWKKEWPFSWTNKELFTKECIVPSLVKISPMDLENKIFKILFMHFHNFVIIPQSKRVWFFIWNLIHPRMLWTCTKFCWNWPTGSRVIFFIKSLLMNFCCFSIISPCKRWTPCFNKLESPSSKDVLCQVWLKLTNWFWRGRIFNFINIFSLFCNHLPLEKDVVLYLNKLNSLYPRMLCTKFNWKWPSGSGAEEKNVKSLRWMTNCDQKSSLEPSAQVNFQSWNNGFYPWN